MIVVKPRGGLCNYLRVIFSYYLLAQKRKQELIVIWVITDKCPGWFLDFFEPVKGIIFERTNDKQYKINHSGCRQHRNFQPNYTYLKPLSIINNIIKEKQSLLNNNYIAVHVRRTDHVNLAQKHNMYTSDTDFCNFIDNEICKTTTTLGSLNLYIATDNNLTYDMFKQKYNNLVKIPYHDVVIEGFRKTSLRDAIVDLFMCARAHSFQGSGYSSFSGLINSLRLIPNV